MPEPGDATKLIGTRDGYAVLATNYYDDPDTTTLVLYDFDMIAQGAPIPVAVAGDEATTAADALGLDGSLSLLVDVGDDIDVLSWGYDGDPIGEPFPVDNVTTEGVRHSATRLVHRNADAGAVSWYHAHQAGEVDCEAAVVRTFDRAAESLGTPFTVAVPFPESRLEGQRLLLSPLGGFVALVGVWSQQEYSNIVMTIRDADGQVVCPTER